MKRLTLLLTLIFFSSLSLYAQTLLPSIPDVTGGYVQAFEFDSTTNKLYILGDFTQVGTTSCQGFAVIDITSGNVLPDFNTLTIQTATSLPVKAKMKIFNNKLYVGGRFLSDYLGGIITPGYLFTLDLSDNNSLNPLNAASALSDFKICNNKIYTTGAAEYGFPGEYMVSELDTLGNILWQQSINNTPGAELFCVEVVNNTLFAGGYFSSFNGVSHNNIVKIDLLTHTATTWSITPTSNQPCFAVGNLIAYQNNILAEINKGTCILPAYNINFYDMATGAFNNANTTILWQGDIPDVVAEGDTSFWYNNSSGLKQYGIKNYVASWSPNPAGGTLQHFFKKSNYLFVAGSFTTLEGISHSGLGAYCLQLEPIAQTNTTVVCAQQNNVAYSVVPNYWASNYVWSYSGTGVTINGSGPSVNLDFSLTATSGILSIYEVSYCGSSGFATPLSIPITVNPLPATNAGPDINFTCIHTSDSLNGLPNNSSVSCTWTGPSSYSNASFSNQVLNSTVTGGDYIFTAMINTTGCKKSDTLKIFFDTLKPIINPLSGNHLLTCTTKSLTLDASANYPANDTLHWSGTSFSQNNPASVNVAGTYILTITSGTNGCKSNDMITVTQNTLTPNLSLPLAQDTITCIRDSIQLNCVSTNTNTILYWKDAANDSLLNNSYVNQTGVYSAHALDTVNGCPNQTIFIVSQFTTPPVVNITPGAYQLNCSTDTVILNGSSPNAGASLLWTGAGSFSSSNPATTILQGTYILNVTNPQNGCPAKDSVTVTKLNNLGINISGNTSICHGSSTTLSVSPIGGTPAFSYLWNNSAGNSSTVLVTPLVTTIYIATVKDSSGCIGSDSVKITVPPIFSDSIATFIPCDPNHPNGQIQVYATGGTLPYTYSLNGGMYQTTSVFPNLAFGTYTVSLRDGLGCPLKSNTSIDSSSLGPSPDFILSTNQIKGDTFVLVDISNPRPDSVRWILPAGSQLTNSNAFAPEIINADTGVMQITMLVWFGNCQMSLTKNIHINKSDTLHATNYNANGIKDITLYPNPNTGNFTVDVSLYKIQTFAIFIFDALGNELLRLPYTNLDFISAPVSIPNPSPGTYLLKVISEYDSKTKTIQVTN
jgi:hypothetical protein